MLTSRTPASEKTSSSTTAGKVSATLNRLSEAVAGTQTALQEVQRTNHKLEHLAATDPLTGAGNRRQFIQRIGMEIGRAKRNGSALSLLALDLDHFERHRAKLKLGIEF